MGIPCWKGSRDFRISRGHEGNLKQITFCADSDTKDRFRICIVVFKIEGDREWQFGQTNGCGFR